MIKVGLPRVQGGGGLRTGGTASGRRWDVRVGRSALEVREFVEQRQPPHPQLKAVGACAVLPGRAGGDSIIRRT